MFSAWHKGRFGANARSGRTAVRFVPRVEALEDRLVPSTTPTAPQSVTLPAGSNESHADVLPIASAANKPLPAALVASVLAGTSDANVLSAFPLLNAPQFPVPGAVASGPVAGVGDLSIFVLPAVPGNIHAVVGVGGCAQPSLEIWEAGGLSQTSHWQGAGENAAGNASVSTEPGNQHETRPPVRPELLPMPRVVEPQPDSGAVPKLPGRSSRMTDPAPLPAQRLEQSGRRSPVASRVQAQAAIAPQGAPAWLIIIILIASWRALCDTKRRTRRRPEQTWTWLAPEKRSAPPECWPRTASTFSSPRAPPGRIRDPATGNRTGQTAMSALFAFQGGEKLHMTVGRVNGQPGTFRRSFRPERIQVPDPGYASRFTRKSGWCAC